MSKKNDKNLFEPENDPAEQVDLPEDAYRRQILAWTDMDNSVCTAPESEHENYRKLVKMGIRKGWPEALEAYAYGAYGGNNVFEEDWKGSEKCLLKLIATVENPSPFYYNTLGYIYYYGRTNNGKPQYEKAYQYFSIGAIHGVFESMYKVADMLIAGKGVPKNVQAAFYMIKRVYDRNRDLLEEEKYDCKFADAALRLGGIYERGDGVEKDMETAYSLYLQADFAIRERMKRFDFYGDKKVASSIRTALARAESALPPDYFTENLFSEVPYMVNALLNDSEGLDIAVAEKGDSYFLVARRADGNADGEVKKRLFILPKLRFTALSDAVVMRIEDLRMLNRYDQNEHSYINHIEFDKDRNIWRFAYFDLPLIELKCRGFSFEV